MTIQAGTPARTRAGTGADYPIEARGLVKTYPKGVRALDGLGFAVPAGTVFAMLGPNGAGKSTTVKILTTLAQADAGTATVAGLDVRAHAAQVRRAIGVVAQRSGADPEFVSYHLFGPPPATDHDLLQLARALDDIERQVTRT